MNPKKKPGKDAFEKLNIPPEMEDKVRDFLRLMAEIAVKNTLREFGYQQRLKDSPEGFHVQSDETGSCQVCGQGDEEGKWYDKYGTKCMSCQDAVNAGIIPSDLVRDDFCTLIDLELDFSISAKTVRSWIKKGIVKSRTIIGRGRKSDLVVFLRSDNENFFPPKEMLGVVQVYLEPKNEAPYYTWLPWYHYCDVLEYLKDYGIVHYLGT